MRWILKSPQNDKEILVELIGRSLDRYQFLIDGRSVEIEYLKHGPFSISTSSGDICFEASSKTHWRAIFNNQSYDFHPQLADAHQGKASKEIHSPMPGKILKILIAPHSEVKKGQALFVIEAMKMENEIRAEIEAKVSEISVQVGQSIEAGALLIAFE